MSTKMTPSGSQEASRNHSDSSFLIDKVKYILESPTQRTVYKRLKDEEDKIDFFLNHFIINDYTARQLKNLYLNDPHQRTLFIEAVETLIKELDEGSN